MSAPSQKEARKAFEAKGLHLLSDADSHTLDLFIAAHPDAQPDAISPYCECGYGCAPGKECAYAQPAPREGVECLVWAENGAYGRGYRFTEEGMRVFGHVTLGSRATPAPTPMPVSEGVTEAKAEHALASAGVFKGHHGLRGLLESREFWEQQPYTTRLYYGEGGQNYLQRGVLRAAVELLDKHPALIAERDGLKKHLDVCKDQRRRAVDHAEHFMKRAERAEAALREAEKERDSEKCVREAAQGALKDALADLTSNAEFTYAALRVLCARIEAISPSAGATKAVVLAFDLLRATGGGDPYTPPDEYAEIRVRAAIDAARQQEKGNVSDNS